jgi:hypothetical protein
MTTFGSDPVGSTTDTSEFGTTGSGSATTGTEGFGTTGTGPSGTTGAGTTGTGTTGTTDKAKEAASTAADQSKHVAGTAKDEAANVAGTAAEQARTVLADARQQVTSQVSDQAITGRDKLSETLRTLGDDLQQMAQGQGPTHGMATDLAQEVSDRVRALGSHLENRDPSQLLDDARDFARRRPGVFLAGALAAGVVAGRLFRATADGAAAASLAEDRGTNGAAPATYTGTPDVGADYGTGVGVGPMGTASGNAPLANQPDPFTGTTGTGTQDLP